MALIHILKENETNQLFLTLLRRGLISISILDKKVYYEYYLDQCKLLKDERVKNYKMQALQNTCEEFKISQKTVYNSINEMES